VGLDKAATHEMKLDTLSETFLFFVHNVSCAPPYFSTYPGPPNRKSKLLKSAGSDWLELDVKIPTIRTSDLVVASGGRSRLVMRKLVSRRVVCSKSIAFAL
jgi:hypothetical protein